MALVARTVDGGYNVKDYFLALIPIDNANAESLYNHIVQFFNENKIDYKKKLIRLCCRWS